jgi:predicted transcriptional regulator of viral defense system
MTTQHRNVVWLVTPHRLRDRRLLNTDVRIVNPVERKFFGYGPVNVLGFEVMMSDRKKTAIDCVDRPDLSGGVGEAAYVLGRASKKLDCEEVMEYLRKIDSIALARKVGWLLDHVGADPPNHVRSALAALAFKSDTKAILGPKVPEEHAIGYQRSWKLIVNVTERALSESAGRAKSYAVKKCYLCLRPNNL